MTTLLETPTPSPAPKSIGVTSSEALDTALALFADAPDWLLEGKRDAWKRFDQLPMPTRTDERWRFGTVGNLEIDDYVQAIELDKLDEAELIRASNHIEEAAGKSIFVDGKPLAHIDISEELREQGVVWLPIQEALLTQPELMQKHFMSRLPEMGSEKFIALHQALTRSGTVLFVPRGVEIEKPLVAYHWTGHDRTAIFPHTLVVAEDNARVTMLDVFSSLRPDTQNYAVGVADVVAGAGSQVFYKSVQDWSPTTTALHLNTVSAERDAQLKTIAVHTGSAHCRNEQHNRVLGPGANIDTYSLAVVTGEQEIDQRTLQTHVAGNATSNLLYKNALLDNARTIFSGLIRVEPNAQQTDAYQTNRNLLLSDTAEANSLPGLEIEANDVKCSHGATTGNLSGEEVFYLRARGLPLRKAQELLVFGFFEEIIEKFDDESIANWVRSLVQRKFHQ